MRPGRTRAAAHTSRTDRKRRTGSRSRLGAAPTSAAGTGSRDDHHPAARDRPRSDGLPDRDPGARPRHGGRPGIDSIKRVEILGKLRDEFPGLKALSDSPEMMDAMARARTLGVIVDRMTSLAEQSSRAGRWDRKPPPTHRCRSGRRAATASTHRGDAQAPSESRRRPPAPRTLPA